MGPPLPTPPTDEQRYELLSSWRAVVPLAILAGVGATLALVGPARWVCGGGAIVLAVLWFVGRTARPTLVVDGTGYRVEERGRERLCVSFAEVVGARAVPAEHAMYLDCGDRARNLLLPPRRGFGFRFERQSHLYVRLARALDGKLAIVERLESPAPVDSDPKAG